MNNFDNVTKKCVAFERKTLDWLWYGLIFLFAMNFSAKSNQLLLGIFSFGIIVTIYKRSTFKMTVDLLFIWLFSFSYLILLTFHGRGGFGSLFIYMISPVGCFFIGYCIVKSNSEFILKTIMAIVFGNFTHGFLNMIEYFRYYGFTSSILGLRHIPDFWQGGVLTATLQSTFYTLIACLLFYSLVLLINKQRKGLAILIILSIGFSLLATFVMGNRTLIILMLITFFSSVLLYSFLTRKSPKYLAKNIAYIAFAMLGVYLIYTNNLFGIREFVEGSTWYIRFNIMAINEDPRIQIYQRAAMQMFDFPFGGYKMDLGLSYAHNLWIDVLYATGLFPFSFLLLFTFETIKNLIRLISFEEVDIEFKILIFSIYTGYFINFMIEPILEGVPYMFLSFCLISGMIRKKVDVHRKLRLLRTRR